MIKNVNTFKSLIYLLTTFVVGFILLISLHLFFLNLIEDLDNQTKNLKNKLQIGEYIAEDLFKIQSSYYALATTTNSQRSRNIVIKNINDIIANIDESLSVLEKGGTLKRFIRLNIAGHNNTTKTTSYYPKDKNDISLESIDIKPKLLALKQMVAKLDELLALRAKYQKEKDTFNYTKTAKEIRRNYKSSPAFFTRATENIRRLLYDGEIELRKLNDTINSQKQFYSSLEVIFIVFIVAIVLGFGFLIAKQINRNNKKLHDLNDDLNGKMQKLSTQEASIRGILDAQPSIVILSDGQEMLDANLALVNFFDGYTSFQQFKDQHACICDFFETDVPNDEYIVKKEYEDGLSWIQYILKNSNEHYKVIMKSGDKLHHFSILARKKVIDSEGNFIVVVSLNDITKEVKSRLNLKELNDNLEAIVNAKTEELQTLNTNLKAKIQEELEKGREKDKQMIQQSRFAALGEMIGNIAHQWRQPLSAISSTASSIQLQMQLGLSNDKEINESYSKIIGYVDFLTQTIEDFRGFFKEDKEFIEFNMNTVVNKTLSIVESTYKDKEITLNLNLNKDLLLSDGMPSELSQVFLNVLNNARDVTEEKQPEKRIVHLSSIKEDGFNVVYIQDNAGGIPEGIIEKIFDPYFTTKHQAQGTGIGLYMSKNIIEKTMLGSITVENREVDLDGEHYNGACFRIAIPKK